MISGYYCSPDKNKRFDWLISGPSKAVLDHQKGVLDRKIEGLLQWPKKWTTKIFKQLVIFLRKAFLEMRQRNWKIFREEFDV